MKTWKWRSSRLFNKKRSGGFAFHSGILQYRIYPKGFVSQKSKCFELNFQKKDENGEIGRKWIVIQEFSLREAFKTLRKEIKNNNWNILE